MNKKLFRYYYWLILEFIKKNSKYILLSFFVSFIGILSIISLTPYFQSLFFAHREIIGSANIFDLQSIPEEITTKISSGLLFVNEKGEIVPSLAADVKVTKGGKEYTVILKDNLFWNNGKEFTAFDINYQFKDVTVKVQDKKTIIFTLKDPLPIFPTYLEKPIIKYPMIGVAGLYTVERIKTDFGTVREVTLSPNKKDVPFIIHKYYPNETQLIAAYKKGEITEMQLSKKSIVDTFKTWKNTEIIQKVDYSQLMTLFINSENGLLKEKDMRHALQIAIDPSKFKSEGQKAVGSVIPLSWAYNPNLKRDTYDMAAAKKIINKNISSSDSAQLNLYTSYEYSDVANVVLDEFKKVGFTPSVNYGRNNGKYDLLLAYWKVPMDPDQYYFWHSKQIVGNITHYKNVKIDKLLEDGRQTTSTNERKKIYYEFQRVLLDDPPAVFLYYPYIYTIKRK